MLGPAGHMSFLEQPAAWAAAVGAFAARVLESVPTDGGETSAPQAHRDGGVGA